MGKQKIKKVVRDGKVAVLVSPGYGAGWSTWSHGKSEKAVFAPDVVEWVEAGKPNDPELFEKFERKYGYTGGLRDVEIHWVPEGEQFLVDEYDGFESIRFRADGDLWTTS